MIRALYTAAGAMASQTRRMDLTASNLFFAQIPGFKAARLLLGSQVPTSPGLPTDVQAAVVGQYVDPSEGPLRPTNKPLDLALEGDGFFSVRTKAGVGYTRDGRFHRNAEGELLDGNGNALLGERGPIRLPAGARWDSELVVKPDGTLLVDAAVVDRLQIVDFPNFRGLQAAGGSLYFSTGAVMPGASEASVRQGALEDANTSGVVEMTRTIEGSRAFESYQKVIQTIDEATGESVRRIGRLA